MQVLGVVWLGARTEQFDEMFAFCTQVLGLAPSKEQPDFAVFELPNGDTVEVFGPSDRDHTHFTTGPVVGFLVEDIDAAVTELRDHGTELLGPVTKEPASGMAWAHFRAPDGNVYELTARLGPSAEVP